MTVLLCNGLAARTYWISSILAPRFLVWAFFSGPAILLEVLRLLRRPTRFEIQKEANWKVAQLMAHPVFPNLCLASGKPMWPVNHSNAFQTFNRMRR